MKFFKTKPRSHSEIKSNYLILYTGQRNHSLPSSKKYIFGTSTYYDILDLKIGCSSSDIKKAYHKKAMLCHPDKAVDTDAATEMFKLINEAYRVLSDPQERAYYDRHGKKESGTIVIQPSELLRQLMIGECFQDFVGDLSICSILDAAMNAEDPQSLESATKSFSIEPEAMKTMNAERVSDLCSILIVKLDCFIRDPEIFKESFLNDVEKMKLVPLGATIMRSIGHIYSLRADQHLSQNGFTYAYHRSREKFRSFKYTLGTVKALIGVYSSVSRMEAENKKSENEEIDLESEVAEKANADLVQNGLVAMLKYCRLEIENVLKEVLDKVFDLSEAEIAITENLPSYIEILKVDEKWMAESKNLLREMAKKLLVMRANGIQEMGKIFLENSQRELSDHEIIKQFMDVSNSHTPGEECDKNHREEFTHL